MSFVVTSLGSVGDTTARSDNTVALSRAPADNALVLVSVVVSDAAGTAVEPSSVSGSGLIFSLITSSVSYSLIASPVHNLSVWRGMGSSLVNSVITAHFDNANTGCCMLVDEVSGVSTSGTSGSGAVGQSATSRIDNTGASRVTIIGPSATSTANAWFAVQSSRSTGAGLIGGNYTSLNSTAYATPDTAINSTWTTLSTGTIVGFGGNGSDDRAGILVELVLDNPAIVVSVTTAQAPRRFRIPPVPSQATGILADWCRLAAKQLNQEGYISLFSGVNPNTSGFTGIPGNLLINIGSASTSTRLWELEGAGQSVSTNSWRPLRIA